MSEYRPPARIRLETTWENGVELDLKITIPPEFDAEDTQGIFDLLSETEKRVGEIRLVARPLRTTAS